MLGFSFRLKTAVFGSLEFGAYAPFEGYTQLGAKLDLSSFPAND